MSADKKYLLFTYGVKKVSSLITDISYTAGATKNFSI